MRIRLGGSDEVTPVFGALHCGLLIPAGEGGALRVVPEAECTIVDGERSVFWAERNGEFAFEEFFEPWFSHNLDNGAPRETFVIESYRVLFDREFPRADLKEPKYCGNGLVMCPHCGGISRPLSFLGVIRCTDPRCRAFFNNPFYDLERIRESIEWGRLSHLSEYRGQYYCPPMRRYYPAPPGQWALIRERLSGWFRELLHRCRPRRGQEK